MASAVVFIVFMLLLAISTTQTMAYDKHWHDFEYENRTMAPSMETKSPTRPTTKGPTIKSTSRPTNEPSSKPTTIRPTRLATEIPTITPSRGPTLIPSQSPTIVPSARPSREPTTLPTPRTRAPSESPTPDPTKASKSPAPDPTKASKSPAPDPTKASKSPAPDVTKAPSRDKGNDPPWVSNQTTATPTVTPALLSAFLDATGQLTLSFATRVTFNGAGDCGDAFVPRLTNCKLQSTTAIGYPTVLFSSISLVANKFRTADRNTFVPAKTVTVTISPLVTPIAILKWSSSTGSKRSNTQVYSLGGNPVSVVLGSCEDVVVDWSESLGSLSRNFARVQLDVVAVDDVTSELQTVLNALPQSDAKSYAAMRGVLPGSLVLASSTLKLTVVLLNAMGIKSVSTHVVSFILDPEAADAVQIQAVGPDAVTTKDVISLKSTIRMLANINNKCAYRVVSNSSIQGVWEMSLGDANTFAALDTSLAVYTGKNDLRISAARLSATISQYSFRFTALGFSSNVINTTVISKTTATILGGNRVLVAGENATLTVLRITPNEFPLVWSCISADGMVDCGREVFGLGSSLDENATEAGFYSTNSTMLTIPSYVLAQDTTYMLSIVSFGSYSLVGLPKPVFLKLNQASASESLGVDIKTSGGFGNFNYATQLVFRAKAKKSASAYFYWTQLQGDLSNATMSQLTISMSPMLVIPPLVLSPYTKYTFAVSATSQPSLELSSIYAYVAFRTNAPPRFGQLFVDPLQGTASSTVFSLTALLFQSDALPLSYSFYSADCNASSSSSLFSPISPFTSATEIQSTFGGPAQWLMGVVARDSLGASNWPPVEFAGSCIALVASSSDFIVVDALISTLNSSDANSILANLQTLSLIDLQYRNNASLSATLAASLIGVVKSQGKNKVDDSDVANLAIANKISKQVTEFFPFQLESSSALRRAMVASLNLNLDGVKSILAAQSFDSAYQDKYVIKQIGQDVAYSVSNLLKSIHAANDSVASLDLTQLMGKTLTETQVLRLPVGGSVRFETDYVVSVHFSMSKRVLFASPDGGKTNSTTIISNRARFSAMPSSFPSSVTNNSNDDTIYSTMSVYTLNPYARLHSTRNQTLQASVVSVEYFDSDFAQIKLTGDGNSYVTVVIPQFEPYLIREAKYKNQTTFCGALDQATKHWSSFGCRVESLTSDAVICQCNHTSDYTAWVETGVAIALAFTDTTNFSRASNGIVVVVVLCIWALITLFLSIVGYWMDERDMQRRVRGMLISLKLKRFQEMQALRRVFASWRRRVDTMTEALQDQKLPFIPILSSLLLKSPTAPINEPTQSFWRRLYTSFSAAMIREHTLLGTVFVLDAFLTRPTRVMCGSAAVLGEMFASAMFYYFDQDDTVTFGTQFLVAFLSALLVWPFIALFVVLAKRVMAYPGAQRQYLQQMMVVVLAELGENQTAEDVEKWKQFAKHITWRHVEAVHTYQVLKENHRELTAVLISRRGDNPFRRTSRAMIHTAMSGPFATSPVKRISRTTIDSPVLTSPVVRAAVGLELSGGPSLAEQVKALEIRMVAQRAVFMNQWKGESNESQEGDVSKDDVEALPQSIRFELVDPAMAFTPSKMDARVADNTHALPVSSETKRWLDRPTALSSPQQQPFTSRTTQLRRPDMRGAETPRPIRHRLQSRLTGPTTQQGYRWLRKCCLPAIRFFQKKPVNQYVLGAPGGEYLVSHKFIFVAYFVLLAYYAVAFFFILSFGFRVKNEKVLAWLPTVVLAVVIDLLLLQPFVLFIRYALFHEVVVSFDGVKPVMMSPTATSPSHRVEPVVCKVAQKEVGEGESKTPVSKVKEGSGGPKIPAINVRDKDEDVFPKTSPRHVVELRMGAIRLEGVVEVAQTVQKQSAANDADRRLALV